MNTLEQCVGGMADIPQWFAWKLTPNAQTGKFGKQPCTLDGARCPINAADSANWHDFDTVAAAVARLDTEGAPVRYAMGFWLTRAAGYWFLDLDHALGDDGQWLPFASQLVACYPNAMVERSSSGRGLHVVGMGLVPPHRNKPPREVAAQLLPLQLEFYSDGRGIAFGLDGHAQGCADTRFDVAPLCATYFPPPATAERDETTPRGGFKGTDDELIQRALNARESAAVAFGGRASFGDLWNGRAEQNSDTDAALIARLAWWTDCDEQRIAQLMLRSGLRRDKWNERRPGGTYLTHSISEICAKVDSCYQEPQRMAQPPILPPSRAPMVQNAADLQQRTFNPIQWALQDLLPEGVTILSSDPKLGKSWMVYAWCIAIATGRPIWEGRASEKQGDALLLALEDNDRRMRRRLDKLLPTFGSPDIGRLYYSCEWPRAAEGVAAIRDFLIAHPDTRIVVIDTIAAFRNADPGRKNQYSWDYEVGALLKPLSQEFQCAFVLVSHNRKPGNGDTHVNQEVSGTTGLTGGVDNVFVLKRSSAGNVTAVLHTDGRDIEQQLELALQLHDGRWEFVGNAADVNRSQQRSTVLEAIALLKGCGTAREIHEAMGATERLGTLRVRLSRMVKAGELELNGKIYTRVDPAAKFVTPLPPGVTAGVTTLGV